MKYAVVSDLHVDFYKQAIDWPLLVTERVDAVVIAGDIDNSPMITELILSHACDSFDRVIYNDGNHEHYNSGVSVEATMDRFRKFSDNYSNLTYLDGTNFTIVGDVGFFGANGWYDFTMSPPPFSRNVVREVWRETWADAQWIVFDEQPDGLAVRQATEMYETMQTLQNLPLSSVVAVTHTVPHRRGLTVKHQPSWDIMNGVFGNAHMAALWERQWDIPLETWIFGHTHTKYDFTDNGVRFLCNPRGYPQERNGAPYRPVYVDTTDQSLSAFGRIEK